MELKYRGVAYTPAAPKCTVVESGAIGTYRGQVIKFRTPSQVPPQPVLNLKYRGVAYQTNAAGQVESCVPAAESAQPQTSGQFQPSAIATKRHSLLQDMHRVHQRNIQQRLIHRLEVARSQGNLTLVHQLEAEMSQFA